MLGAQQQAVDVPPAYPYLAGVGAAPGRGVVELSRHGSQLSHKYRKSSDTTVCPKAHGM